MTAVLKCKGVLVYNYSKTVKLVSHKKTVFELTSIYWLRRKKGKVEYVCVLCKKRW